MKLCSLRMLMIVGLSLSCAQPMMAMEDDSKVEKDDAFYWKRFISIETKDGWDADSKWSEKQCRRWAKAQQALQNEVNSFSRHCRPNDLPLNNCFPSS